jgi:hypothetical protein
MNDPDDRTASLMTPAKLAQLKTSPKPASSPAAWLDQLAADAGSGHARRLVDLRRQVEGQVRERDYGQVRIALEALGTELPKLDFDLLQPKGWLARATGRGKEAAGFVAHYERLLRAGEDLGDEVQALQRRQQLQGTAAERSLVEVEVEVRALEKIMEQGTRWLQDMRNQLKASEAQGADEAARKLIAEDAARCELLVGRLKQLRAAVSAAQKALEACRAAVGRRTRFLEGLHQLRAGEWAAWQKQVGQVADEAAGSGSATELGRAKAAHQEVQAAIKQVTKECLRIEKKEQALADELVALHDPLQAAA